MKITNPKAKILCYGSINLDHVYSVNHIAREGETITATAYATYSGGKGLNQSIALARAGGYVYHAGVVGPDGASLVEYMQSNNINTDAIRNCNTPTGHAIIQCDASGQNSIICYGGANHCVRIEDIKSTIFSGAMQVWCDIREGRIVNSHAVLNLIAIRNRLRGLMGELRLQAEEFGIIAEQFWDFTQATVIFLTAITELRFSGSLEAAIGYFLVYSAYSYIGVVNSGIDCDSI